MLGHGLGIGRAIAGVGHQQAYQRPTWQLKRVVVLLLCNIGTLQVATPHTDITLVKQRSHDKRDVGVARSENALVFQVDQGFGITGVLRCRLLPERFSTTDIARFELGCRLIHQDAVYAVCVKGVGPITQSNVLPIRGPGCADAISSGSFKRYRCSAMIGTLRKQEVGETTHDEQEQ